MKQIRGYLSRKKAQTAIELAVFGSVLIFIIGIIVRQALNFSYVQNQNLKAMRLAMTVSFEHSQGLKSPFNESVASDGTATRNNASVLFVEDRLNASSGKYAAIDRIPQIVSGNATHSRNLFMPVEAGEDWNMPIMDLFVNGVHIPLTVAKLKVVRNPVDLKTFIPNHDADEDWDPACAECFDLDRDGIPDVPAAERAKFSWQWKTITKGDIDIDGGNNTSADVDGDLREERILDKQDDGDLVVMDFQDGDIDLTVSNFDRPVGFTNDALMFTRTKTPGGTGTYLLLSEGKLFETDGDDRQFIRSAQKKDSIDIVQREFVLSNNTGRFCTTSNPSFLVLDAAFRGDKNPVEKCCGSRGCCFSAANIEKICMVTDPEDLRLFIRSRILDQHGRKWVTDVSTDPVINFIR